MLCKQTTSESREITLLCLASMFCNTGLNKSLCPLPNNEDVHNGEKAKTEAYLNKYFQQGQQKAKSTSCWVCRFRFQKETPVSEECITYSSINKQAANTQQWTVLPAWRELYPYNYCHASALQLHHPILHQFNTSTKCLYTGFAFDINQSPKSFQGHACGLNIG